MPTYNMPGSMSLELKAAPSQNIKQLQHLIMSRQMQQAIHFLQVPVMELSSLVDMEMEQNPVLEYSQEDSDEGSDRQLDDEAEESHGDDEKTLEEPLTFDDNDFDILKRLDKDFRDHFQESNPPPVKRSREDEKLQTYLEASIQARISFFEHLTVQAKEAFNSETELTIAETIIGSLDDSGFFTTPLKEVAMLQGCTLTELEDVLKVIQEFDPPGVAACSLQSSLLKQLKMQGKENTLSYTIIDQYFDDLIHNRLSAIQKATHSSSEELRHCIDDEIAKLDLHPRNSVKEDAQTSYAIPDVAIKQEGDEFTVKVNEELQPELRLNSKYLRMLDDESLSKETKDFIKQKVLSAKWLMRNILKRNSTLESIAKYLAKHQRTFFLEPEGKLIPLTMKTVADEIEVHESTVARAVSNKYIDTPKGIMPLRTFFTSALETNKGDDISSQTVKDLLKKLIDNEDKRKPLSDETLSKMVKAEGIQCARRTVAKYRGILKLGTAQQRRKL